MTFAKKNVIVAPESDKVKRAREKLMQQFLSEKELITPEALEIAIGKIQHWITRHARERINLKDKSIKLFDDNKHAAKISSQAINKLRSQIKKDLEDRSQMDHKDLRGRIFKKD